MWKTKLKYFWFGFTNAFTDNSYIEQLENDKKLYKPGEITKKIQDKLYHVEQEKLSKNSSITTTTRTKS